MKEIDSLMALKSLSKIFNKMLQKQNRFKTKKIATSPRVIDTTFKQYNTPPAVRNHRLVNFYFRLKIKTG